MFEPLIWAHRGASCLAPENTMSAFNAAAEFGADGLELDIHLSADGVPVVIHDDTLDRTTDGHGPVAAMDLEQLWQLDAGSWFSADFAGEMIPALQSVLDCFGLKLRLNLELKEFRTGVAVMELIKRYPDADIVLSSFDYQLLYLLRKQGPALSLAVLFESGRWRDALRIAVDLQACAFHPALHRVSRPMIAACRKLGLPVFVWTVDSPTVAKSLIRAGASGVFSNSPQIIRASLR